MNSCCTRYYTIPEVTGERIQLDTLESCGACDCHCGYILYESLAPHMSKLMNDHTNDDDHNILEAKLRQQIVEVSRMFDLETLAKPGEHSKAHYQIIKLFGDGTRYLKIPEYVDGTLELYTKDGFIINPESYEYKDGFLILNPCINHTSSCGCVDSCGMYQKQNYPPGWNGCLQARAKFGKECSDYAVQLAVRLYIIELNSYGEVRETNYQGLPISRGFKVPHAWDVAVRTYKDKKQSFNTFAFA